MKSKEEIKQNEERNYLDELKKFTIDNFVDKFDFEVDRDYWGYLCVECTLHVKGIVRSAIPHLTESIVSTAKDNYSELPRCSGYYTDVDYYKSKKRLKAEAKLYCLAYLMKELIMYSGQYNKFICDLKFNDLACSAVDINEYINKKFSIKNLG